MLKFFRKIRQNLLSEGKNAKYIKYAIGEIVLVVIGILIALQINNWNESRKEANYEQKILDELKSDFSYNKAELNRNIKKANKLASYCDSLLLIFDLPKEEVDLNKLSSFTRRLSGYSTFNPSNGALNNLLSSGNLNIIKNDSLRMHLSRWSGILEDVKEDEKRLIEFGDNRLDPITLQYLNPRSKSAKIDPDLLGNPKFENIVRKIRASALYIVSNYETLDLEIASIIEDIN